MRSRPALAAVAVPGARTATGATVQATSTRPEAAAAIPRGAKRVRITYEDVTNGQGFSPRAWNFDPAEPDARLTIAPVALTR